MGFDVCELAPREGPRSCTYAAAKLVYKLIAYASRLPNPRLVALGNYFKTTNVIPKERSD